MSFYCNPIDIKKSYKQLLLIAKSIECFKFTKQVYMKIYKLYIEIYKKRKLLQTMPQSSTDINFVSSDMCFCPKTFHVIQ